jgi:hypothetical protein
MQENQFTKKGLYSLINRLINNDCGYLIPYSLFDFALPLFPPPPLRLAPGLLKLYSEIANQAPAPLSIFPPLLLAPGCFETSIEPKPRTYVRGILPRMLRMSDSVRTHSIYGLTSKELRRCINIRPKMAIISNF